MQFGGVAAENPDYRKQLEAELERTDAMCIWGSNCRRRIPKQLNRSIRTTAEGLSALWK